MLKPVENFNLDPSLIPKRKENQLSGSYEIDTNLDRRQKSLFIDKKSLLNPNFNKI
jgi:hypothetical protein